MAEFEGIVFEIKGNADPAADSLHNFAEKLKEIPDKSQALSNIATALKDIKDASKGFEGANFQKFADGLKTFAEAMDGLKGQSRTISSVANALNKFSGVSDLKISPTIATGIQSISEAVAHLSEKRFSLMERAAQAISTFSKATNVNVSKTIGEGIRSISDAVSTLTENNFKLMERAADALSKFSAASGFQISKTIAPNITKIAEAVDNITDNTIRKIEELTAALSKLRGIDLKGFSSAIRQVKKMQEFMDSAFVNKTGTSYTNRPIAGLLPERVTQKYTMPVTSDEEIAKIFQNYKPKASLFEEIREKLAQKFSGLLDKTPIGATGDLLNHMATDIPWDKVISGANKLLGVLTKIVMVAKQAFDALKKLAKRIVVKVESATLGKLKQRLDAVKSIFRSLGRIAFYRAIRSMIKAVTKAFTEGLEHAYFFSAGLSDAVDGRIATSLDNITTKALTMKNQLGAAFGSLLVALEPVILTLINLVTQLATAITQLFAAVTGGTFLKAKDTAAKFAEETKKGSKAAKEWKNQLMGFDEINKLTEPSSGSGGSGKDELDPNDMFEVMEIESAFKNFIDDLKKAIKDGDWQGAGELLASKINGLVAGVDWKGLGAKLGNGLNGAIQTMYYTLKNTNFRTLGWSIAQYVNSAIEQIDFTVWGRLLVKKLTSALDWLMGFLGGLNWSEIGISIGEFLRGALDEATEWLNSHDWETIAKTIKENIDKFIQGLDPESTKESLRTFLKTAFDAAFTLLDELFPNGILVTIASTIGNLIIDAMGLLKSEDFKAAANVLKYKITVALFGEKFAAVLFRNGQYAGSEIVNGMIDGLSEDEIAQAMENKVNKPVEDGLVDLRSGVKGKLDEAEVIVDGAFSAFGDSAGTFNTNLKTYTLDINGSLVDVGLAAQDMATDGSGAFDDLEYSVSVNTDRITWNLDTIAEKARNAWDWLKAVSDRAETRINNNGGMWTSNFASGGFPDEGQLFVAREAGAELVGNIGGHTAVANNEQIVTAISRGVYDATVSAMSASNKRGGGEVVLNVNGREFMRAIYSDYRAVTSEHGVSLVTGG